MKPEFTIEKQGKLFVLYAGLLDEAHTQGLESIQTQLLQVPAPENGQTAIAHAVVKTSKGVFSGIGDASPANVTRAMENCIIRMAETRAKARALRDAVNVATCALEELADYDTFAEPTNHTPTPPARASVEPPPGRPSQPLANGARIFPPPGHPDRTATPADTATPSQIRAIYKIADEQAMSNAAADHEAMKRYSQSVPYLTKKQASAFIDLLKTGELR